MDDLARESAPQNQDDFTGRRAYVSGRTGLWRVAAVPGFVVAVAATLPLVVQVPPATASLGEAVPAAYRGMVEEAAAACPGLPAEVLAAQLMQESGFDPAAVSHAGAQGIAQFMPGTWAAWGRDVDGNGVASPFDPADAIDAQGRHMCDLIRRAQRSGLPGDPIELALAGYNAGWGAVLRYGGVPPYAETQDYVARITATAVEFRAADSTDDFTSAADFADLPRPNPHTVAEAIAFARAAVDGPHEWRRRCLNFVAQTYGYRYSGTVYAIDHYRVVMPRSLRHDGDRSPPPGALLFWDTGSRAGHVALYVGGGLVASSDILSPGAISIVPAADIERRWGATYVGWSPPYFPNGG
jgi:hypothetical protein